MTLTFLPSKRPTLIVSLSFSDICKASKIVMFIQAFLLLFTFHFDLNNTHIYLETFDVTFLSGYNDLQHQLACIFLENYHLFSCTTVDVYRITQSLHEDLQYKHFYLCQKMSCLSVYGASSSVKEYHQVQVGTPFKHAFIHSADIYRAPTWNLAFYKVQ